MLEKDMSRSTIEKVQKQQAFLCELWVKTQGKSNGLVMVGVDWSVRVASHHRSVVLWISDAGTYPIRASGP
jgi:hypothetical protein